MSEGWRERFEAALTRFSELPQDWNGYDDGPPSSVAIANMRQVLDVVAAREGLTPVRIAPFSEGVMLHFRLAKGDMRTLEAYNDGGLVACISDGGSPPEVWELDPTELDSTIARLTT